MNIEQIDERSRKKNEKQQQTFSVCERDERTNAAQTRKQLNRRHTHKMISIINYF